MDDVTNNLTKIGKKMMKTFINQHDAKEKKDKDEEEASSVIPTAPSGVAPSTAAPPMAALLTWKARCLSQIATPH